MIEVKFKPQSEFPLIAEYANVFKITPFTIFAFGDTIYCKGKLPEHLIVHETVHLERQQRQGVDKWVEEYLTDPAFRLNEEVVAYRKQLQSISRRDHRARVFLDSVKSLSSDLYGNIVTRQEAMRLLRI